LSEFTIVKEKGNPIKPLDASELQFEIHKVEAVHFVLATDRP
jgi:hypothetical protein